MRSILKLQKAIYHQYALYTYGKITPLSAEEKAMLEIYAKVDNGSSWIELIPLPIINAVSKRIKTMTGNQMLVGIAIVSIAITVCMSTSKVLDYKLKLKEKEMQTATLQGIQKTTVEAQIEALKAQADFYKEIVKQTEAKKIEINEEEIEQEKLKTIISSPTHIKSQITQEVISNSFKVTDIHIADNEVSIDVIGKDGMIVKNVIIFEQIINANDYRILKDSTNRMFMTMTIMLTKKSDKIIGAVLHSIEK